MTEQPIQTYQDDEINLLDILVALAESWKLLVFGPLLVGILAAGFSFLLPNSFESVAIVRLTEEEAVLLHATPVLDTLIEKFGLLAEAGGILDDARQNLKKRLVFTADKKTKLTTITGKARTPDAAQALASSAIATVLKELQVKGQQKVLLEKSILINSKAIANAEDALDSIQRGLKKSAQLDQAQESAIKNFAAIISDISKRSQENEELRQKLEPRGVEVFVQEPTLPQRKVSPRRSLIVLLAVVASGFVLLIYIYIRKAWISVVQDIESASKVAAIKRAFGVQNA